MGDYMNYVVGDGPTAEGRSNQNEWWGCFVLKSSGELSGKHLMAGPESANATSTNQKEGL